MEQKLETELETVRKKAEKFEDDAKDAPELRKRADELQRELEVKRAVADTVEGKKIEEVLSRLSLYQTVTYILGTVSAILAAAVGYFVMRSFDEPDPQQQVAESCTSHNNMSDQ